MLGIINGFEILDIIEDDVVVIYDLFHKLTSARLIYKKNKKENSKSECTINIKTPLFNNKGISHVLEHCIASSLLTVSNIQSHILDINYISEYNIYTLIDRTNYGMVINDKDYLYHAIEHMCKNVFRPQSLANSKTFEREAWGIEDGIKTNGIVINEMNRVFNDPISLLYRFIPISIGAHKYISGGIPNEILELTYDEIVEYHNYFYRTSNSFITVSGDDSVEKLTKKMNEIMNNFIDTRSYEYLSSNIKNSSLKNLNIGEETIIHKGEKLLVIPCKFIGGDTSKYIIAISYQINKPDSIIDYLIHNFIRERAMYYNKKYNKDIDIIINTKIRESYTSFITRISEINEIYDFNKYIRKLLLKIKGEYETYLEFMDLKKRDLNLLNCFSLIPEILPYDFSLSKFCNNKKKSMIEYNYVISENYLNKKDSYLLIKNYSENFNNSRINCINKYKNRELRNKKHTGLIKCINYEDNVEIINSINSRTSYISQMNSHTTEIHNIDNNYLILYEEERHCPYSYFYFYYNITDYITDYRDISGFSISGNILLEILRSKPEFNFLFSEGGAINLHIVPYEDLGDINKFKIMLVIAIRCKNASIATLLNTFNKSFINTLMKLSKNEIILILQRLLDKEFNIINRNIILYASRRLQSYTSSFGQANEAALGIEKYMHLERIVKKSNEIIDIRKKLYTLGEIFNSPHLISVYSNENEKLIEAASDLLSKEVSDCSYVNQIWASDYELNSEFKNETFNILSPNEYLVTGYNTRELGYDDYIGMRLFSEYVSKNIYHDILRNNLHAYEGGIKCYQNGMIEFSVGDTKNIKKAFNTFDVFKDSIMNMALNDEELNSLKNAMVHYGFYDMVKINKTRDNFTRYFLTNTKLKDINSYCVRLESIGLEDFERFKNIVLEVLSKELYCIIGN